MAYVGADNSSKEKLHTCSHDFCVILVGGFRAGQTEVEEAAWELCKKLFDYSERKRKVYYKKVKSIVNTSTSLREPSAEDVTQLQKYIFEARTCEDGITCIIFSHSHGAKVAKKALTYWSLSQYLIEAENRPENDISRIIVQRRKNLAVFTLGGIDDIAKNYAKLCVNIRLRKDLRAFIGRKLYSTDDREDAIVVTFSGEDQWSTKEESTSSSWLSGWMDTTVTASVNGTAHILNDYVNTDGLLEYLMDCIAFGHEVKTECACVRRRTLSDNSKRSRIEENNLP